MNNGMNKNIKLLTVLTIFALIVNGFSNFKLNIFVHLICIIISYFCTYYINTRYSTTISLIKILKTVKYCFWLAKEILLSSINVAVMIWHPKFKVSPKFTWIKFNQQSDFATTIYANSITLTPGTITVEIENNQLLIHSLDENGVKELEENVMAYKISQLINA